MMQSNSIYGYINVSNVDRYTKTAVKFPSNNNRLFENGGYNIIDITIVQVINMVND